jgi:hypothetical protein
VVAQGLEENHANAAASDALNKKQINNICNMIYRYTYTHKTTKWTSKKKRCPEKWMPSSLAAHWATKLATKPSWCGWRLNTPPCFVVSINFRQHTCEVWKQKRNGALRADWKPM